ncbi:MULTISPECIES: hypothetical protein [unclassified Sphingobacterium]|uniref:hypothetical protein n=1 Tax=unclassified Sphingobacterium TaxID=2609468 RepID=UPI0025F251A2|nr:MULTISPECIES: hypothetical protein [unclassified Sphingobacterium]
MSKSSSRVDDQLWKSILEQTFAHFLEFFFEDAASIFDLSKPFDYLDKEFESLFPPEPNGKGVRFVDKLVKVYLKEGGEQFVLCHIEVQSSRGKGDLAERMFRYYYKISDKYQVPISAIAILTDDSRTYHPSAYIKEFMGTILHYRFSSYKVLHQDEVALRSNSNPFSVVVLTTLLAITNKNISDDKLKDIKHDLYEQMMSRKMDKKTRQGLYDFLTYYVSFQKQENFYIFEKEVENKLGRSNIMGTQEYLLDKAEKQGIEKGRLEERAKLKAEKRTIALEFKKMGLPVADIAKGTGLSIEEIEKLK